MISTVGSRRRWMPSALGLALSLGLSLAVASQPALADINEAEAGLSRPGSTAVLLPETQLGGEGLLGGRENETSRPIILADKKKNYNWNNNENWNKNKNWSKNKDWNKNWSKNYRYKDYVQPWYRKPHYGQFFGGVVLGSILTAGAIGVAPPPPSPELCWYWIDPYRQRGYWDYCPPLY